MKMETVLVKMPPKDDVRTKKKESAPPTKLLDYSMEKVALLVYLQS